jgi:8-oxo-dGTP pyrophosphatase MutT (NUDIX family)
VTDAWQESYHGQLRALAGDRTLLFTGTRVLARDDAGRLLLIRRRDDGRWALPAGAMDLGESISACAARELREETGLIADSLTLVAMHTGPEFTRRNVFGDTYQFFAVVFRVDAWHGELIRSTDETVDAAFFPDDALPEPRTGSVADSVADLIRFESTGAPVLT